MRRRLYPGWSENDTSSSISTANKDDSFRSWWLGGADVKMADTCRHDPVSYYRPNSERGMHYVQLWGAIDRMRKLPTTHSYHLDSKVAEKAITIISALHDNFEGDMPRLLPEDSENLVLTWDRDGIKRFLSITEEEQDVLTINKTTRVKCESELPDEFNNAMGQILQILSFPARANTSSDNV